MANWRNSLEGKVVHLVFYCHADWQWEQSRRWHEERYALVVREALQLMRSTPDFTMVIDNVNEFLEPVWERLSPAERQEFLQRVEEGRIGIAPAGVANCRPTHVGEETFIRNLVMGRKRFAELFPSADLGVFQSVDVSIGHSQLPQILSQAGFNAYRAWRPEAVLDADGLPRQFLWQGLDGSKILVLRGPYFGLYDSARLLSAEGDWEAAASSFFAQLLAQAVSRTPSSHVLAYIGYDDARPLRTYQGDLFYDLPGFLAQWRQREAVPIVFDRPCDMRDAVLAERERLPTVRGALDGAECGYNMSWLGKNGLWPWRLAGDLALVEAERWACLAWWHGSAYPQEKLEKLWREHLTYQAHAQEAAFAPDFAALLELAAHVRHEAGAVAREARGQLLRCAGLPAGTQCIFNPHSFPVEGFVELYHVCPAPGAQSLVVTDLDGKELPSQVVEELRHPRFGGSLNDARLLAKVRVPALGFVAVRVRESAEPPAAKGPLPGATLELGGMRLGFAEHSLRHVEFGGLKYLNPAGGPWPTLAFHHSGKVGWYGPRLDEGRLYWQPRSGSWVELGPHRWCHRAEGELGHFLVELRTYAWADEPRLDFCLRLLDRAAGQGPAGFLTLRLPLPTEGQLRADIPFGVEERRPLQARYMDRPGPGVQGATLFERPRLNVFWARSWVQWSNGEQCLALVSADGGPYYIYEEGCLCHVLGRWVRPAPGTWEERAWAERAPGSALHAFSWSLLFGPKAASVGELVRFAAVRRMPLGAVPVVGGGQALGRQVRGLQVDGPAVLSAAYVENGACLLRLYECEGKGGWVSCQLPGEAAGVQAVDFLGNSRADVELSGSGELVRVLLGPWQIVTLRIERAG